MAHFNSFSCCFPPHPVSSTVLEIFFSSSDVQRSDSVTTNVLYPSRMSPYTFLMIFILKWNFPDLYGAIPPNRCRLLPPWARSESGSPSGALYFCRTDQNSYPRNRAAFKGLTREFCNTYRHLLSATASRGWSWCDSNCELCNTIHRFLQIDWINSMPLRRVK